jgi:hypothetical protein
MMPEIGVHGELATDYTDDADELDLNPRNPRNPRLIPFHKYVILPQEFHRRHS